MIAESQLLITVVRKAPPRALYPFTDYFQGFEKVQAVREVLGKETDEVLRRLKVGFTSLRYMYMGVSDEDGNMGVGLYHLKHSAFKTLYLDIVHELFHLKQRMEDIKYFHEEHMKYLMNGFNPSLYYKSPIEIPAYIHAVREAERIGMSYDEIVEYLKIGEVDPKIFAEFLGKMKLKRRKVQPRIKPRVRINRKATPTLFPFTDYFKGFERTEAVRALFGASTEEALGRMRIEITRSPVNFMMPSEEDGHLVVGEQYLEGGDLRLLYVDVVMCLNILKRLTEGRPLLDTERQEYGDSPVIIESYTAAVDEARRIGVSYAEIADHFAIAKMILGPENYKQFLRKIGLPESN